MIFFKQLFFYILIISAVFLWRDADAQDYDFDIPEEEESAKIEFNGNLDAKWGILQTNDTSPYYGLQFFGQDKPDEYLSQYRLDFYFNGDYRYKQVGFTMRTFSQYTKDEPVDISFFELYGSLNLSPKLTLTVGKRRYNWGKGYAFNPVGYVNAEKDPENPDLALAGKNSLYINYNHSFASGLIQNLSISTIVLPQESNILERYSNFDDLSTAFKLYLLLNNIDLDFMVFTGKNHPQKYGVDFSTNLQENIEIHGEVSYATDDENNFIQNNAVQINETDGFSYLLGFRYLNDLNITFIAEYYHNNQGLTQSEYENYLVYLKNNLNSNDPQIIRAVRLVMNTKFRSKNLLQDYIYLKASLPEPFEWLYSSASIFTIYNVDDNSFILSPQIGFKPFINSEILFWPSFFLGENNSEYGSRQIHKKVEIWFRFYF